jgi:hypothetical protein
MQESCLFNNVIYFQQVTWRCCFLLAVSVKRFDINADWTSGTVSTGHGIISVEALKLNAQGQRMNETTLSAGSLYTADGNVDRKFDALSSIKDGVQGRKLQ